MKIQHMAATAALILSMFTMQARAGAIYAFNGTATGDLNVEVTALASMQEASP